MGTFACDCLETRKRGSPPAMPISSSRARRSHAEWSNRSCSTPSPGYVTLRVPVSQRLPFRISEEDRTLRIRFYGAAGDVNFIRYGVADTLVRRMSWEQSAADEVTLTLELSRPVWGYRARWDGNDLLLDVRRPPAIDRGNPLSGRLIAVDPGHPPGGATGPTGLREAEANLAVALELRRLLESAGAHVLMTPHRPTRRSISGRVWPWRSEPMPMCSSPFTTTRCPTESIHSRTTAAACTTIIRAAFPSRRDATGCSARLGLRDLGIGRGDFALVRGTWMPSVLTEGTLHDVARSGGAPPVAAGQRLYALAVFEGLRRFLDERRETSSRSVWAGGKSRRLLGR